MADNIDSPAVGLSIAEAEAIADDRPELIWLDVDAAEYYGQPRNMEPGGEPTPPAMGRAAARRVAAGADQRGARSDVMRPALPRGASRPGAWGHQRGRRISGKCRAGRRHGERSQ